MSPKPKKSHESHSSHTSHITHHKSGSIHKTPHNTYRARIRIDGTRHQCTFKTIALAKAWIEDLQFTALRSSAPLTPDEYRDAQLAFDELPDNVTLLDAVRAYNRAATTPDATLTVADAVTTYLADKAAAGLRPRSIKTVRLILGYLPQNAQLNTIRTQQIDDTLRGRSATTRNNHIRAMRTFFRWCEHRNLIDHNPTAGVTKARRDPAPPGILTVDQTRALLEAARDHDPELLPYFVLGLYCGIRTAELSRLTGLDIDLENARVRVPASAGKTRVARYTDIPENAVRWLQLHKLPTGRLLTPRKRIEAIRAKAGITQWPPNAMRHSFATYHLALHQNAPHTAHQLGHRSPQTLYQHYRNLVTAEAAQQYFQV